MVAVVLPLSMDPIDAAAEAGLRWIGDDTEGLRRRRAGKVFPYLDARGRVVRDPRVLARIRALAIPPAWTDVWICPRPDGHVQATGRDARGRKQYRYHPRWRAHRDQTKFEKMLHFGAALPRLRARVAADLGRPGLPRDKVLATVVRLLETTLIRVGNEEYAAHNHSYGLTTLRNRHVDVAGAELRFSFRGKGGIRHAVAVHDRRLARVVRRCQELPGQELFQYLDGDGRRRAVGSQDVNDYLRRISGLDITAKDFRTWNASVLAAAALRQAAAAGARRRTARAVGACIEAVARRLGNTKAICRKCYVHPGLIAAFLDGTLARRLGSARARRAALGADERALLAFLRGRKGY